MCLRERVWVGLPMVYACCIQVCARETLIVGVHVHVYMCVRWVQYSVGERVRMLYCYLRGRIFMCVVLCVCLFCCMNACVCVLAFVCG